MYEISVTQHFEAAHFLRNYQGKCEALHGHRYELRMTVESDSLDEAGMAYDFLKLKERLHAILSRFDHTCLNDVPPFDKINPSSENIATTIYNEFQPQRLAPASLRCVEVWESPESGVAYSPD